MKLLIPRGRDLKIKIGIFVITHNKSPQYSRATEICNKVESVMNTFENTVEVFTKILAWQPDSRITTNRSYIKYQCFKYQSYRIWFGYGRSISFIRTLAFEIKSLMSKRSQLQISKHLIYVATVVSQKNVRAWETIVDHGLEAALILEDDAILNLNNLHTFEEAMSEIASKEPTFINLARGNDLSHYKFKRYESISKVSDWKIAPIADTACAYLINSECAKILLNEYRSVLKYDSLAIDFMLSDIFMRRKEINVLHHKFPPFSNGTLFGLFKSQTGARVRGVD